MKKASWILIVLVAVLLGNLGVGEPAHAGPAMATTIVVDNGNTGSTLTSGWKLARTGWTRGCAGIDGDAHWTYSRRAGRTNDADWTTWEAALPQAGRWEVQVYIPGIDNGRSDTAHARYRVQHAGGEAVVEISQRNNWCRWISLGTFQFDRQGRVYLGDYTGGETPQTAIAADAVRWVYVGGGGEDPHVAGHFAWPVNPPNGSGWGTCGVGYSFLQWACVSWDQQDNCTKHEWHPGVDLNWCGHNDRGQPVYAVANGVIEENLAASCSILIRHTLPDGSTIWSNVKHVVPTPGLKQGQWVRAGEQIGTIEVNHTHFEIRTQPPGKGFPGCVWTVGRDKQWVIDHYTDPLTFIAAHR